MCMVQDVHGSLLGWICTLLTDPARRSITAGQDLDGLGRDLSDVDRDLSDVDHDLSDLDRDLSDLDRDLSDVDHDLSDLDRDLSHLDRDLSDLDRDLSDLDRDLSDLSDVDRDLSDLSEHKAVCRGLRDIPAPTTPTPRWHENAPKQKVKRVARLPKCWPCASSSRAACRFFVFARSFDGGVCGCTPTMRNVYNTRDRSEYHTRLAKMSFQFFFAISQLRV